MKGLSEARNLVPPAFLERDARRIVRIIAVSHNKGDERSKRAGGVHLKTASEEARCLRDAAEQNLPHENRAPGATDGCL